MLRKLLLLLTALLLAGGIALTALQIKPFIESIQIEEIGNRFEREAKRYTVTATADEGGTITGVQPDYAKGDTASLVAHANEGYSFNGWRSNKGTLLSLSEDYSFSVDKNEVLTAKFVPTPDDATGSFASAPDYTACAEDFQFPVYCTEANAEEYIKTALTVVDADLFGTEYQDLGIIDYTVVAGTLENEFKIVPSESYRRGTTYIAIIDSENVEFTGSAKEITFTIEGDKSSNSSYTDEIKEIDRADVTLNEEDSYIISNYPFVVGDIACIYTSKVNDIPDPLTSIFIEITSVDGDHDHKYYYVTPDLENVYADLSIFANDALDLASIAGLEFADDLQDQLRTAVLTDDSFIENVSLASESLSAVAAKNGYYVELISEENIADRISFTAFASMVGDQINIEVMASYSAPIKDKSGTELAQFVMSFDVTESIKLTPTVSAKLRQIDNVNKAIASYHVGIRADVTETSNVKFDFIYNGKNSLSTLENDFNSEIKNASAGNGTFAKIKDVISKSFGGVNVDEDISIFKNKISVPVENFSMEFDIKLSMKFDVGAALQYSATSTQTFEMGLRSSGNGPQYYERTEASATAYNDLIISGKAFTQFGIKAEFDFKMNNLITASFKAEIGTYAEIAGCANISKGSSAAYLDVGSYKKLDYAYYILGSRADLTATDATKNNVVSFGYKDAVLGFENESKIEGGKGLSLIHSETNIAELPFLNLHVLNFDTLNYESRPLDINSKDYIINITLGENSNFTYENGVLRVKPGAPAYFKENITISIKSSSLKWTNYGDGKTYNNLPAITIPVEFGNEDAYYASKDTNIQKQFREIYRSYNEHNADILINGFEELIESFVTIPEDKSTLYHDFTSTYLKHLFNLVKEYRGNENPSSPRENENKFVNVEATVFESSINLLFDIMDGKDIEEEELRSKVRKLLDDAEATTALYNTLTDEGLQENDELKAQIKANMNDSTKERIRQEISAYEEEKLGDERAQKLAASARNLFDLNEEQSSES